MRIFLAFLAMIVCPSATQACADWRPFALEDIRGADAIFTGRLTNYARINRDPPAVPGPYGLLTVDVDAVIKGYMSRRVELAWHNSTFGIPDKQPTDVLLLIAAVRVEDDMPGPVWRVLQTPCAPAFMLDDTPDNRADVRKALSGEAVPPRDYFALQLAEPIRKQTTAEQAPELKEPERIPVGWISAIFAMLVLAGWLLVRRKN